MLWCDSFEISLKSALRELNISVLKDHRRPPLFSPVKTNIPQWVEAMDLYLIMQARGRAAILKETVD